MNRQLLSLGLAAASLLAAPLAFAQSTSTDNDAADQQSTQSAMPANPANSTMSAQPQQDPASTQEQPANQITWSELDADHDGALSRTEAAPVDSLSTAFDSADTDKDGSLTADEYKAYRGTIQESPAPQSPTPQDSPTP